MCVCVKLVYFIGFPRSSYLVLITIVLCMILTWYWYLFVWTRIFVINLINNLVLKLFNSINQDLNFATYIYIYIERERERERDVTVVIVFFFSKSCVWIFLSFFHKILPSKYHYLHISLCRRKEKLLTILWKLALGSPITCTYIRSVAMSFSSNLQSKSGNWWTISLKSKLASS